MASEDVVLALSRFARLPGRVYAVVSIDGDTSAYVQVVKADLLDELRQRGEHGVVLAPQSDGSWLYLGVHYAE